MFSDARRMLAGSRATAVCLPPTTALNTYHALSDVVYGPLSNGATTLLFESVPTYPDAGRYWQMVQDHKINQFYTAPTAIRMLIKHGVPVSRVIGVS